MDEIINNLEFTHYWIRIDTKKAEVLSKGTSFTKTKEEVKNLAENNLLNNAIIYYLTFEFNGYRWRKDIKIGLDVSNYKILDRKLVEINIEGKYGCIYFENEWLLNNKWNSKYISNIIQMLRKDKMNILIPGINIYHLMLFKVKNTL